MLASLIDFYAHLAVIAGLVSGLLTWEEARRQRLFEAFDGRWPLSQNDYDGQKVSSEIWFCFWELGTLPVCLPFSLTLSLFLPPGFSLISYLSLFDLCLLKGGTGRLEWVFCLCGGLTRNKSSWTYSARHIIVAGSVEVVARPLEELVLSEDLRALRVPDLELSVGL